MTTNAKRQTKKTKAKKPSRWQRTTGWLKRQWKWLAGGLAAVAVGAAALLVYMYPLNAPALPQPSLKDLAAAQGVEMGMLVHPDELDKRPFVQVLTGQYSMITSDGQIHWDTFRPTSTTYDFRPMDTYVAFAKEHGMAIEGHHLTWEEDNSLPSWLKKREYSKDELLGLMREHITTVVSRYKEDVKQWTVVNEPFSRAQHIYGLDSWWTDHVGIDYIDQAFLTARQADPDAELILNDFYNETKNTVSDAQYEYMKSAKERGIPIDGIGVQLHVDTARPPEYAAMVENLKRFVDLGYGVYFTEFDINSSNAAGSKQEIAAKEAQIARDVVRACLDSGGCKSITNFGMTDKILYEKRYTRGGERSYLLDSRYRPKASYNAFHDALVQPGKETL